MKKTYKDVDRTLLVAIPNPDKKTYEIKIKQPELTFLGVYEQPDFALLLSWHLQDSIIPKLRQNGFKGKFIIPLPTPKII